MHVMCSLVWKEGRVLEDWTKAAIVLVYKGKGYKSEWGCYRENSLFSIPGRMYGKILIDKSTKNYKGQN